MSQSICKDDEQFLSELETVFAKRRTSRDWEPAGRIRCLRSAGNDPSGSWGDYLVREAFDCEVLHGVLIERSSRDLQSEGEGRLARAYRSWKRILIGLFGKQETVRVRPPISSRFTWPAFVFSGSLHQLRHRVAPEGSAQAVLQQLRNGALGTDEKRKAILAAEVLDIPEHDVPELCVLLGTFIVRHRDSNVAEDLVAVGAAVRKLVAYLPCEGFGGLAELLMPGQRSPVPLDVELEVAKTIVWKLAANPPVNDNPEPALGDRMWEIAQTYLNPRLIAREKHGATALNAALSLMLLRSPHAAGIPELVRETKAQWFTELLCRRAERLRASLRPTVSADRFPAVSRGLAQFLEECGRYNG